MLIRRPRTGILNYRRVDATANARVDTLFMNMLGVEYMNAYAASSAEEGTSDIEISLVVDVSGSMGIRPARAKPNCSNCKMRPRNLAG